MKAIELEKPGAPLQVVDRPMPQPRPDGVVIRMKAAPILSYMQGVVAGTLPYMLPKGPFIPGSDLIGTVEKVGSEVFDLEPGTLVHGSSQIASRGRFGQADDILIGLTGMTPVSPRVQNIWPDGAFAEFAHYPVDCITPLGDLASIEPQKLTAIMFLAVPYGGLLAAELKPAETVIIGGATGNFGAHAVLVALAMGASRVVPTGRNAGILEKLKTLAPKRVFPATLAGEIETDTQTITSATAGLADCYFDIVGGGGTTSVISAIRALRAGGRTVLMGALQEVIPLPYVEIMVRELTIRGNFMYPRSAVSEIAHMIAAGTIDLSVLDISRFALADAGAAIADAAGKGGFAFNVLTSA
ncbi:MAG: zinc-binding dehydrogenase [Desulfobacterales bacterium]|nr:zinc-binding dehydrogenase [Desulfobacterales bacterium]